MSKRTKKEMDIEKAKVVELIKNNPDITINDIVKKVNLNISTIYTIPEMRQIVDRPYNKYYKKITEQGYTFSLSYSSNYKFKLTLIKDDEVIQHFNLAFNGKNKAQMQEYLKYAKHFTNVNSTLKEVYQYIQHTQ